MIRLFIAIPLPPEIEHDLLSLASEMMGKGVRPVHSVHLTLKFLGWVNERKVGDIRRRLARVSFDPFELQLQDIGFFPDEKRKRVVWVGVEPQDRVIALQQRVEDVLNKMFPKEDRFVPHLTLARIAFLENKDKAERIKKIKVEHKKFLVDRIVLYQSVLHRNGPEYKELMAVSAKTG